MDSFMKKITHKSFPNLNQINQGSATLIFQNFKTEIGKVTIFFSLRKKVNTLFCSHAATKLIKKKKEKTKEKELRRIAMN